MHADDLFTFLTTRTGIEYRTTLIHHPPGLRAGDYHLLACGDVLTITGPSGQTTENVDRAKFTSVFRDRAFTPPERTGRLAFMKPLFEPGL